MTQYIPKIISATVGLALLGVGAWLLVAGHADEGAGLLAASLAMLGAIGTMALPSLAPAKKRPDPKRDAIVQQLLDERDRGTVPPSDGALALALCVIAAACAVAVSGCGAGAYGGHARAATIGAAGLSATGDVIDAARDRALDAVEAAHPVHGPERDAALEAEAARWRPAGVALDDAREGLLTYIDAVQLAETSGTDGLVAHLDVIAARFLALFNAVVATATEAGATGLSPLNLDSLFGGGQ